MKSDKDNRCIRDAQPEDRAALWALWKACFQDTDAFMSYYFEYYLKHNRVLMLEQDGYLRSMLHLNPYHFFVNGQHFDSYYVVGVATDATFRHQKAMTRLLCQTFADCYSEALPFIYLMPAKEAIYTPFQFAYIDRQYLEKTVCVPTKQTLMATELAARSVNSEEERQRLADQVNTILQKTYDGFVWRDAWYYERLQMENRADGGDLLSLWAEEQWIGYLSYACEEQFEVREIFCLPKWQTAVSQWLMTTLRGQSGELLPLLPEPFLTDDFSAERFWRPIIMGRIICLEKWMQLMPSAQHSFSIRLDIIDRWMPQNNGIWCWQSTNGSCSFSRVSGSWDLRMDIDTLMQWLCGYWPVKKLFEDQRIIPADASSVQNWIKILQCISVLNKWMINEIV